MGAFPDVCKVADTIDFTLTPTLSVKGEGELKRPATTGGRRLGASDIMYNAIVFQKRRYVSQQPGDLGPLLGQPLEELN